jgi:hypothetical protein
MVFLKNHLLDSKNILYICNLLMVDVAQLVRAPDCGSGGRGFKPHPPPIIKPNML